jgi:hypothetical protein
MMMKKTLVLVMVLSMAGFASAALQLEVSGGKALVTGQLDQDLYLILSAGDGATLSNFALGKDAPLASISDWMQGSAEDFRSVGVPIPAGFDGEGWYLASFPGEAYKTGTQLQADLAVTTTQETRTWEELVIGPCPYGWPIIRTWTEVTEIQKGALSLGFLALNPKTGDIDQMGQLDFLSLDSRKVIGLTFVDGPCPEPATLALLGLGMIMIRRKRSA